MTSTDIALKSTFACSFSITRLISTEVMKGEHISKCRFAESITLLRYCRPSLETSRIRLNDLLVKLPYDSSGHSLCPPGCVPLCGYVAHGVYLIEDHSPSGRQCISHPCPSTTSPSRTPGRQACGKATVDRDDNAGHVGRRP